MSKEQIKNIIGNNSHEAQMSEKAPRQMPQKTARKPAALIVTR
jgi:hypothetical protein